MRTDRAPPALDALLAGLLQVWADTGAALLADTQRRAAERAGWPPLRPHASAGGPAGDAAFGWAELVPPTGTRLAALQLAFDCVLEDTAGGWQLRIVRPRRWRLPWVTSPRHRVEIRIAGGALATGEVHVDGMPWKRFAATGAEGAAT
jgi:hypothetical protein